MASLTAQMQETLSVSGILLIKTFSRQAFSQQRFAEELADDPQVQAMGMIADLVHPVTGPQRVVGPIVRMSATPTAASRPAPSLGGHTREVLAEAGLAEEEIEALIAAGVVSSVE